MRILALKLENGEYEIVSTTFSISHLIGLIKKLDVETVVFGEKNEATDEVIWEKNFTGGVPWDFRKKKKLNEKVNTVDKLRT